jgi:hypothetical protein
VFYICSSLARLPNSEGSSPVKLFKLMPLKEKVNSSYCDTYICNVICRKEAVEYIEMNAELQTHQLSPHISLPVAGLASYVEEQEAENEKMWRGLLTSEKKIVDDPHLLCAASRGEARRQPWCSRRSWTTLAAAPLAPARGGRRSRGPVAEEQSGDPTACSLAPSPAGEMLQRIRTRGGHEEVSMLLLPTGFHLTQQGYGYASIGNHPKRRWR